MIIVKSYIQIAQHITYQWFKMRPNLFSSPFFASTVRTKLEKRCTRGLRREMDKLRPALQSSRIQITLPESSLPEQPGKGCDVNSGDGSLICDLTSAPSSPEYQVSFLKLSLDIFLMNLKLKWTITAIIL